MSLTPAILSVDLGRGTRRFQRFVVGGGAKPASGEPREAARRPRPGAPPGRAARSRSASSTRATLIRNPVMFVVEITAVLVTLTAIADATGVQPVTATSGGLGFQVQIAVWLWFTVLFATYAEAVAEARGRAQAATLRKTRSETTAHRRRADGTLEDVGSSELRKGDIIVIEEGETIPGDGDVIEGVGLRQRGRHHRRVGAGPQGAGHRHPELGHRRDDARQRPARRPRHGRPGRDVPRPDDRPGRGRQAPADAERDRPVDPARRPDDRLPDGRRHPSAVRAVRRDDRRHGRPRSPCSSASSRRPSAACCRPSASPAWTGSPGSTCWR